MNSEHSEQRDEQKPKKRLEKTWVQLVGVAGAIILFVLVAGLILDWYINPEDAKAKRDLVQTLALITAGVAGAFGIYFTWRGQRLTREGLEDSRKSAQETFELTQQGQLTERFTRAIDQLGSTGDDGNPRLEVRLGAISALERIARDSERDHWPIMEVLTAYVRDTTSQAGYKPLPPAGGPSVRPRYDVQAALTVLGRRKRTYDGEYRRLDLSWTDLRGIKLIGDQAQLQMAILIGARLDGAMLAGAHLEGAFLQNAQLPTTVFERAHLVEAHLTHANVFGSVLVGADLRGANLRGAALRSADLRGADLRGAVDLTVEQIEWTIGNEETKLPEYLIDHRSPAWSQSPEEQLEIIAERLKQEPKDE